MSLITPAVYREHDAGVSLPDDAIQRLIDANEDRMVRLCGPHSRAGSPVTVTFPGVTSSRVYPVQPVGSISVVSESWDDGASWTALVAEDYEVEDGGLVVHRLRASRFASRVRITYVPLADLAERVVALIEMVSADVAAGPAGVTSRSIGAWSETYGSGADGRDPTKDRILARLRHGAVTFA